MKILGLHDSHNANAALISDGRIVRAVEEERFSRIKNHDGLSRGNRGPVQAAAWCLEAADGEIDAVALPLDDPHTIGFRAWKSLLDDVQAHPERAARLRFATECDREVFGKYGVDPSEYHSLPSAVQRHRVKGLMGILSELGLEGIPVHHMNHHLAHHASAYYCSGRPRGLSLTLDGRGDDLAGMVCRAGDGRLEVLAEVNYTDSIGHFYSAVTVALGFKAVRHEGKVTGLASYKPSNPDLVGRFRELVSATPDGNMRSRLVDGVPMGPYPHAKFGAYIEKIRALCAGYDRETVAASAQQVLEEVAVAWAAHWLEATGEQDVFLSGGVFANVKLNQRIWELPQVRYVYVHPGMTDSGLGIGAALEVYHRSRETAGASYEPVSLDNVFLGPEYSEAEMEEALKEEGLRYRRPAELELEVAKAIVESRIVARFDGRLEYGPRALGNRSILYHTKDRTVNNWLNQQLERTEFMPFAPVTLYEKASDCYNIPEGKDAWFTANFMTITFDCKEEMAAQSPAVVHVDNTARPQLIQEKDNPGYYQILKHYYEITGIPSIVNTSFNLHEEPIVCTPKEAVRSFRFSNLHLLAMGPFLAEQP